ncbi:MAG: hypothetical protein ACYDGN_10445 [Acidimicrobiales bacterium]
MGFLDKVKSQAGALAEKAQEGAKAGQEKLSQMQGKRQSDALLLELGGLVYTERAGRPQAGADSRIEEIFGQLQAFEAANGPIAVTSAVAPPGSTGSYVPQGAADPTGGGIPTPSTGGGIPTASYASDEDAPEA